MSTFRTNSAPESDSHWFYVDTENEPTGPVSFEQLKQLARNGTIRPDTYVLPKGTEKWIPFSMVPTAKERSSTEPKRDSHSRIRVIFYLIFFPPAGLVLLWQNPRFRIFGRIVLSLLTLVTSLPVFLTLVFLAFLASTNKEFASSSVPVTARKTLPVIAQHKTNPVDDESLVYKLASLDAGHPLPENDPSVMEFDRLLSDIAQVKGIPKEEAANFTWAVKKRLNNDGVNVSALELLKAAHKIVIAPETQAGQRNLSYEKLLSMLAALIYAEEQKKQ